MEGTMKNKLFGFSQIKMNTSKIPKIASKKRIYFQLRSGISTGK